MIATPWGPSAVPTGGAGVAWRARIWILTTASTFFLAMGIPLERTGRRTPRGVERDGQVCRAAHGACQSATGRAAGAGDLELRDLAELELDRCLAAEDVDQHFELELVLVELDDLAGE